MIDYERGESQPNDVDLNVIMVTMGNPISFEKTMKITQKNLFWLYTTIWVDLKKMFMCSN